MDKNCPCEWEVVNRGVRMNTDDDTGSQTAATVHVVCPNVHCRQGIECPEEYHGATITCPTCGEQFAARTEEEINAKGLSSRPRGKDAKDGKDLKDGLKIQSPWADRVPGSSEPLGEVEVWLEWEGRFRRWRNVCVGVGALFFLVAVMALASDKGLSLAFAIAFGSAMGLAFGFMGLSFLAGIRAALEKIAGKE